MGIINCCLFLGGYNKHLQEPTTKIVMPIMLGLMEGSYLIYEMFHVPKKSQKITLQGHFCNNLNKFLDLPA